MGKAEGSKILGHAQRGLDRRTSRIHRQLEGGKVIALTALGFMALGLLIVSCAFASHGAEERERQRRVEALKRGGTIK